jgi:hypothetical protein
MPGDGVRLGWAPIVPVWLVAIGVSTIFSMGAIGSSLTIPYLAWDSHAYWSALNSSAPYEGAGVGVIGSFLYPPPFLQLLAPLGRLPWPLFAFGWTAMLAGAAVSLLRRVPQGYGWAMPLLVYLVGADVWAGNINILLAYLVVIGMHRPALWAVVILSKITPGLGVLWHAFRREWGAVLVACGFSLGLAGLSFALGPQLWRDWLAMLVAEVPRGGYADSVPIHIAVRLPAAVVLLLWGARSGRPAVVPLACMLALPVIWFNGLSWLVAAAVLVDSRVERETGQDAHSTTGTELEISPAAPGA